MYVYPCEYMDNCEKIDEASLAEKEDFYSHLNIADTIDAGYAHTKRVWKDSEIKMQENIMICMFKAIHYR